jgi:hypothetical protein
MKPGIICVAGIDPDTGRQIRPILDHGCFDRGFLHQNGGPFQIAALVDLGPAKYVGHAPEWEDHRIDPTNLKYLGRRSAADFWSLLRKTMKPNLTAIFGRALQHDPRDHSSTATEHTGAASLGHLELPRPVEVSINQWGKLRAVLHDSTSDPEISINDIRLWRFDQQTPRLQLIADIGTRLRSVPAILAVGLTRPFQKSPNAPARHYLQLNNVHLQDDPLGDSLRPATDDEEFPAMKTHSPRDSHPNAPISKSATASSRR